MSASDEISLCMRPLLREAFSMPLVKIALDQTTYEQLVAIAFRELRPTQWQAEILLRQAIRQDAAPPRGDDGNAVALATDHKGCGTDKGNEG